MDTHLISLLKKQGMDARFIKLKQDYASRSLGKEHSPYARFWEDTKSGMRFMEAGILPHVTNAGFFIVPQFRQVGKKFIAEENCFEAVIDEGTVRVVCVNDQPNGRKNGDWAKWQPQVFLDGIRQTCGNPLYLEADPINANYHFNTIEWNFGFCKRRARTIPGRFRDRIFITSDPHGEVRVANNVTGNMRLKFGSRDADGIPVGIVQGDVEIISKEELAKAKYPVTIGASSETFYPDADAETSSVDGVVGDWGNTLDWGDLVAEPGNIAEDDLAFRDAAIQIKSQTTLNKWRDLYRVIILFDSSGLPNIATVTGAIFSVYGKIKDDSLSITPNVNVYKSTPNSNTALQADDFVDIGSAALCSTPITYAGWDVSGYNDFTLIDIDTDNFGYIPLTSVTKLGMRNANYDVSGTPPGGHPEAVVSSYFGCYFAEQGNTTSDPKLVVTYTVAWVPRVIGVI